MASDIANSGRRPVEPRDLDFSDLPLHFQVPENHVKSPVTATTVTMAAQSKPQNTPTGVASVGDTLQVKDGALDEETSKGQMPVSKPHQCLECGVFFTRIDHLHRHMKTQKSHVHKIIEEVDDSGGDKSELYPHHCPDCGKGFTRSDHLNRHRRSHIGSRRCKCSQCGQWLPSRPARNQHMWECHGMQLFECGQCAWGFTKASYLTRHLREKHSDTASDDHRKPLHRPYTCGVCSVDFLRASQCSKHMELHCQQRTDPEGMPPFPASAVKLEVTSIQNPPAYDQQQNTNSDTHKRHTCPDCGREFSRTDHLAAHMNKHTGCRPFCCGVCGLDFSQAQDLKVHMRKHTGSKPFCCNLCRATFASSSNLMRHERQHTEEKPFKCSMCDSAFPHRGALVSHERTHTGHRPFSCELCGAKFARNDALKRHCRTHKELRPESQQTSVDGVNVVHGQAEQKSYLSL